MLAILTRKCSCGGSIGVQLDYEVMSDAAEPRVQITKVKKVWCGKCGRGKHKLVEHTLMETALPVLEAAIRKEVEDMKFLVNFLRPCSVFLPERAIQGGA